MSDEEKKDETQSQDQTAGDQGQTSTEEQAVDSATEATTGTTATEGEQAEGAESEKGQE